MAITYIDQSQIRDYRSPTGVYTPTGWAISGDLSISGTISSVSGNVINLSCQNLDVSGALRSPFLSGILGINVTGSGIVQFLSTVDSSGNNVHFRHVVHTGNRSFPIQAFSSQDSQTDWFYFNNGSWATLPALGLNSDLQTASFVRHIWKPTGMDVFTKYFSEIQLIYAGNVTGDYVNSVQFQSPVVGFTVCHTPTLAEYFETADARYVRQRQIGTEFVPSGVKISGLPIIVSTSPIVPASHHGTGTLVNVSGSLYVYHTGINFSGYKAATPFTGFGVASSASSLSGPRVVISGEGQIAARLIGNDTIAISGGGVNQFGIPSQTLRQGNLIISGIGGTLVTLTSTTSGSVVGISGGAGGAGGGGVGNVTGIGVSLSAPLFTGGFVYSGAGSVTTSIRNLGNNVSGIVISGTAQTELPIRDFDRDQILLEVWNQIGY